MTETTEIRVPDIGDFSDVAVIEVLIKPGDELAIDQTMIVLESDKAALDVPSPVEGRITAVHVAVGDRVSKGSLVAAVEAKGTRPAPEVRPAVAEAATTPTPTPADPGGFDCDVVVIGGGPGGYSAAFRAADLGLRVILVEKDPTLGGVCLNVGCIPSKALLHVAAVKEEAERLAGHGVAFGPPQVDLDRLRAFKSGVVKRLTDGLSAMARMRKVDIVHGTGRFASANKLAVSGGDPADRIISFKQCIIAAGSEPVSLPFLPPSERIVNSTGALDLPFIPERMLVIGGGIIGLEMATVYGSLGTKVDVVEVLDHLLPGVDRDAVDIWRKRNEHRFGDVMLSSKVEKAAVEGDNVVVSIAGSASVERRYDFVLQSAGRRPNAAALDLGAVGISTDPRGFIQVDRQMRTSVPNIFAIGDIVGNPMLAHKAVHEGHVAAEAAAGLKSHFDAAVIPSVAYTDPEIAWVGVTEDGAKKEGRAVKIARFPWAASGRAIANGADYGMTKLIFDKITHRIIGGCIVGPSAGDLIGEICLAIEMGADAVDIGKTIHPHPTLGETIGLAAEVGEGVCTDLPKR